MAIPNVNQITSTLRTMSDQQLQQYASMHKNDPYILPMAVSESNARKQMRTQAQGAQGMQPQPKVADADIAAMAQQPQQLPEQQGIGALPAPNMQRMADGGIAGYSDDADLVYNNEPAMRMAEGGVARFADTGLVRMPNESFADFRRRTFEAELQAQRDKNAAEGPAREAERLRLLAARGESNIVPPSPFFDRAYLTSPSGAPTKPAGVATMPAAAYTRPGMANDPRFIAPRNVEEAADLPPANTRERAPAPTAPTAPREPEQSAVERYKATQTAMGGGDRKELDAAQKEYQESMLKGATDRQAAREAEIAARGIYGEAKEKRLAAREEGLGKEKDQMSGLALIEAGLGIMSTPGNLAQAIGKGAKEGLKTYGEGLAKLKLAKERIDDARDQMDEFRRTEANMTAKERREAADDISKTKTEIKNLGMQAAEKMYGYKRADTAAVFSAGEHARQSDKEIASKENIARMQESGQTARSAAQIAATGSAPDRLAYKAALQSTVTKANPQGDPVAAYQKLMELKREPVSAEKLRGEWLDPAKRMQIAQDYPNVKTLEDYMTVMGAGGGGGDFKVVGVRN